MTDEPLTIRVLTTIGEFREAEALQRRAWNMPDAHNVVPLHVLITAQRYGGLAAGAFGAQGEMLGFIFGFLGMTGEGRYKHCSHMLGVLPEAQCQNVGYRLKLFQRQYVLGQDLDLVTWTFDPLEGVNASLNITKLGGIARRYIPNLYGELDGINTGLPSDRFEVEWWLASSRVRQFVEIGREPPTLEAAQAAGAALALVAQDDSRGLPCPVGAAPDSDAAQVLVEVPADFQRLKAEALALAQEWRRHTAQLFTACFTSGYLITDFIRHREATGRRRNFYLLTRQFSP